MEELRATFRPEFLNRVDETIVFRRLGEEELLGITRNLVRELHARFETLGLALTVPDETLKELAKEGFNDKFGARPLRRTVQRRIEDAAAEMLLDGRLKAGDAVTALPGENGIELVVEEQQAEQRH